MSAKLVVKIDFEELSRFEVIGHLLHTILSERLLKTVDIVIGLENGGLQGERLV